MPPLPPNPPTLERIFLGHLSPTDRPLVNMSPPLQYTESAHVTELCFAYRLFWCSILRRIFHYLGNFLFLLYPQSVDNLINLYINDIHCLLE